MRRSLIVYLLLIAATVTVYGQVIQFEFVDFDVPKYVTENWHVRDGLTADGIVWAFTTGHASNWHPLTWLSHMLDCQLYGLNAAGHHATNVLLHILNTLLLFAVLKSLTGAVWPSSFVAALFALHPLHVESVAWVAERKDVLSTLFWLLATWAYVAYARRSGIGRYLLTAVLLALGLMAKPMLVTLPLVLLLLDYWPLERMRVGRPDGSASDQQILPQRSIAYLLIEKLPLLTLSAASCVVTFVVQRSSGAMGPTDVIPLHLRVANAVVSYVRYMGKMIWPSHLSALYPHPNLPGGTPLTGWQVAGAGVLLLAISVLVIFMARRRYLLAGWLWYLGTLVPVIGLIQVGVHSMADRYTYVPLIGLFIIIAWGGADLLTQLRSRHALLGRTLGGVAALVLAAFLACSWSQARYWHDSIALYAHALELAPRYPRMHSYLGHAMSRRGRLDQAIGHYHQALEIDPNDADTHINLGVALRSQGKLDEATRHYRQALQIRPGDAGAHNNLGVALRSQGKLDQAIGHFRQALAMKPDHVEAHNNLGVALRSQGRPDQAIVHFRQALEVNPHSAETHNNLGATLQSQGKLDQAIRHLRQALDINPDFAEAHYNLGAALRSQGRPDQAIGHFLQALRIDPNDAEAHYNLGIVLTMAGRLDAALGHFREAVRLRPDWPAPLTRLAWVLATYPDSSVSEPNEAIRLAERAAELTQHQNQAVL
ncbi:MAG: tetratricopeptide repeat protein, partial [Phycisphaeraceae bacterium]